MIDLKQLRDDPERFREGARLKGIAADIDAILELDTQRRFLTTERETLRAEQRRLEKEVGPQIGQLAGRLKKAEGADRHALQAQLDELRAKPTQLKLAIDGFDARIAELEPRLNALLFQVPLPPDPDVPRGSSAADNTEIRRWEPEGFDTRRRFKETRGFEPRTHLELVRELGLVDFERGVRIAGTRSYVLSGDGFLLHHALLRFAVDFMVKTEGFVPRSVPSLVREEMMLGTGFFPAGRDQAYHIEEERRGGGYDLFLAGTGEVGLMGLHAGEILDEASLPVKYVTVSPCFRREAGAAGKDTAGLYRIHQFDKVEQVVICRADERESRAWHARMLDIVERVLQALELPYRLVQCCTGDLGPKNADMIDVECWMPGRGEVDNSGRPLGAFGETHSASRLYDYQCRRLNMRYRPGGEQGQGPTVFCHSLNNTVLASPRIMIPLLENHQNADGSVTIPRALRPYMDGRERIGPPRA